MSNKQAQSKKQNDKVEYFVEECDHIYINGKLCYIVGV